ncbi:2og-fe oxygenase family protein [Seiridium cupressi]
MRGTNVLSPDSYVCTHEYSIELLSFDPLVIYINNFIKEDEIQHLLHITQATWTNSYVYEHNKDKNKIQSEVNRYWRTSQSAMVSNKDEVSKCLSLRLKSLLGNLQHEDTEQLQLVKYEVGDRFRMHIDWLPVAMQRSHKGESRLFNRLVSSFVYLEDQCTGGETYFQTSKVSDLTQMVTSSQELSQERACW